MRRDAFDTMTLQIRDDDTIWIACRRCPETHGFTVCVGWFPSVEQVVQTALSHNELRHSS